jgi:hypothetical protein
VLVVLLLRGVYHEQSRFAGLGSSGGIINSRMASSTILKCESYFPKFSRFASGDIRFLCFAPKPRVANATAETAI